MTSCKHKTGLYKELQNNNNNASLASYYKDYTKIMLMVIRKAKIIEHDKLTLRQLMSYIYGAPILDVSRSHTTTQHSW